VVNIRREAVIAKREISNQLRFGAIGGDADRGMLEACGPHSDFVINSVFVIPISSFSLLSGHCLAQIAQLFVHVSRINNYAADFLPQNRSTSRT